MKYCTHCGKELLDEAVVCPGCGCATDSNISAENETDMVVDKIVDSQSDTADEKNGEVSPTRSDPNKAKCSFTKRLALLLLMGFAILSIMIPLLAIINNNSLTDVSSMNSIVSTENVSSTNVIAESNTKESETTESTVQSQSDERYYPTVDEYFGSLESICLSISSSFDSSLMFHNRTYDDKECRFVFYDMEVVLLLNSENRVYTIMTSIYPETVDQINETIWFGGIFMNALCSYTESENFDYKKFCQEFGVEFLNDLAKKSSESFPVFTTDYKHGDCNAMLSVIGNQLTFTCGYNPDK